MILIKKRLFSGVITICIAASTLLGICSLSNSHDLAVTGQGDFLCSSPATVVIDAGHGGPDGGATSSDGVRESDINLDIAFRMRELLAFLGQRSVMTRTEDVSLQTPGAYRWKASDLQNRVALANETENSVFLSIHQNSLPASPETHGAQVFYNRNGAMLAEKIQYVLNEAINQDNKKQAKEAPTGIYIMKHIQVPGVLVECGFLSNSEETIRLQQPSYQLEIAAAVTAGFLWSLEEEKYETKDDVLLYGLRK